MKKRLLVLVTAVVLAGCSQTPQGRYSQKYDGAPPRVPTSEELKEPIPIWEPPALRGNMPYEVFGVQYEVLDSAEGYEREGIASWYGTKFHGHQTSSGEPYDMYRMTAAHRYLPIPTFARVTNIDNGQSVIVRINDRGPFHPDRIIDLSYAAAWQLDIVDQGTAPVRVEAITVPPPHLDASTSANAEMHYIQIAAVTEPGGLSGVQQKLEENWQLPATTRHFNGLYRLLIGPFNERQTLDYLQKLRKDDFPGAFRVPRSGIPE